MVTAAVIPLLLTVVAASGSTQTGRPGAAPARRFRIQLRASQPTVRMGDTVLVHAVVTLRGQPAAGVELWPYRDGRQWGAAEHTDSHGQARFLIPMPFAGTTRIRAAMHAASAPAPADWIWSQETRDQQTLYLSRVFHLGARPTRASLEITCDDSFTAFLNGSPIASGANFHDVAHRTGLEKLLRPGDNILAVRAVNAIGPAGLLARLEWQGPSGSGALITDGSWLTAGDPPAGWPAAAIAPGSPGESPAVVEAAVGGGSWLSSIHVWPGLTQRIDFPVGLPLPEDAPTSNELRVEVQPRRFKVAVDPLHRVGIEWEPWFTPLNARWETAEAIPLVGRYDSFNRDVIRQHVLWLDDAGIDFLLVDWSNNLWDRKHWKDRAPGVDELIRATSTTLDEYAALRREGLPAPQVTLLLGLNNGPSTTLEAIQEEMDWVYAHYVADPRYRDLWLYDRGKPLIVVFDGGGTALPGGGPPALDPRFTVRWMASQLQNSHMERHGYWSWMDGVIHPIPTVRDGQPEALTVTPAFFGDGGWTYPQARGRRGGSTYREEFRTAFQVRPQFLLIDQWNEFAGQPNGGGYGPKHDQFVDCYTPELSNDIEPTSTTAPAYRGSKGWGLQYLDLTRSLVAEYRALTANTSHH